MGDLFLKIIFNYFMHSLHCRHIGNIYSSYAGEFAGESVNFTTYSTSQFHQMKDKYFAEKLFFHQLIKSSMVKYHHIDHLIFQQMLWLPILPVVCVQKGSTTPLCK